jgi:O-antigen/teichoic acid export membrane protein
LDTPSSRDSILQKAVRSFKWSVLMEVVSKSAFPLTFVVLARLLTPVDFGVLATAMIPIGFSHIFWEAGLGKALIQTKEDPERAANVVFWSNLGLSLVLYALLYLLAPWLATFFQSPGTEPILRVLALLVVIHCLNTVQRALFERELDLHRIFWVRLGNGVIPGFVSIPLAYWGYGVWALVAGSLTGALVQVVLLWGQSPWRPSLSFDFALAQKLFGFSFWVILETLGLWVLAWGDKILVGKILGIEALGVYQVGWSVTLLIFSLAIGPFIPVSYATYAKFQDDLGSLKNIFHSINQTSIFIFLPLGVGLFFVGPELAVVIFGDKWPGLGLVIGLLGFSEGLLWVLELNLELFRAIGRANLNTLLEFILVLFFLPAYFIAAHFGLPVFVTARLALSLLSIPLYVYFCVRLLGVSPFYLWDDGRSVILATLAMAGIIWTINGLMAVAGFSQGAVLSLAVMILTGLASYIGMLWLLDRSFVLQTLDRLKRVI